MTRPFVLGIDCSLYKMYAASYGVVRNEITYPRNPFALADYVWTGTPDWVELETVRDVTLNLTASTADVTSRKSNGWRQNVSVLKEGSVDFSLLWQPDDPIFAEVLGEFISQCPAAYLILDGPVDWALAAPEAGDGRCSSTGTVTGLFGAFAVTSFTRNETLEEGLTADVTLEPSLGLVYPQWVTLAVHA